MSKRKQRVQIYLGDLHAEIGGIATPDYITKKRKRQYWLNERFDEAVSEIKSLAKRYTLTLKFGGDMVDAPGKQNRDMAAQRLKPLMDCAAEVWGVVGTRFHVGTDGDEDRAVYKELGVKEERVGHGFRLLVGPPKHRVWWSHHGASLGVDIMAGLNRTAQRVYNICRENDWTVPDLAVFHHIHNTPPYAGRYKQVAAAVCPCWQLPNDYAAKRLMWRPPTIGYLVHYEDTGALQWRTFPVPDSLLYG